MIFDDPIGIFEALASASNIISRQASKGNICPKAYSLNNGYSRPKVFEAWTCPKVERATFNGNTTIVFFQDGSKCIVNCSTGDKYDKKTAIAYAIVKRMLGKVKEGNKVDGNGFGCYLQKVVDSAFDQEAEEKIALERKREAKARHIAKQAAEKKAAFEKRVEERAKQILLERAALDRANEIEDDALAAKTGCGHKTCTCSNSWEDYVRPDKPFSKFTEAEKREYWRYHNAKRRANRA